MTQWAQFGQGIAWMALTLFVVTVVAFSGRRWGASALVGLYVALVITSAVVATKMVVLWGLVVPAGVIVYSSSFLITDMLCESFGKKYAKTAVYMGLIGMALYFLFSLVTVYWPAPVYWQNQEAYKKIVGFSARIAAAGLISFFISQWLDVTLFDHLKQKQKQKHPNDGKGKDKLWLRNIGSTATSQLIDTVVFITIAFGGVFPILELIGAQYAIKLMIAILDTPCIYWFRKVLANKKNGPVVE